jgi:hypothetical protein
MSEERGVERNPNTEHRRLIPISVTYINKNYYTIQPISQNMGNEN